MLLPSWSPLALSAPSCSEDIVSAPKRSMQGYVDQLQTLLRRRWDEGDMMRTLARLTAVSDGGVSLEDAVGNELLYLREDTQEPEQLAVTLLGYYRLYQDAWSVVTEAHSVPGPVWATEAEMEMDLEMEDDLDESVDENEEICSVAEMEMEDDLDESVDENKEICSVCLEALYKGTVVLHCRHAFHLECLSKWLDRGRNTCPLCRRLFAN